MNITALDKYKLRQAVIKLLAAVLPEIVQAAVLATGSPTLGHQPFLSQVAATRAIARAAVVLMAKAATWRCCIRRKLSLITQLPMLQW